MNKKQKMICRMWRNYKHNCIMQGTEPLHKYNTFRNVHKTEPFTYILELKNWYRDIKI